MDGYPPDWPAIRETIGADVPGAAAGLECSIEPVSASLIVGENPRFRARITNRHTERVQLVWLLDGSDTGRFPRMKLVYERPSGPFEPRRWTNCGNRNSMCIESFVEVGPGQALDLFGDDGFPDYFFAFHEPGRHVARFEYSTAEDNLRAWLGDWWVDTVPDEFRARFRRIPRLVLQAECAFEVRPRQSIER
jgi:hypothetical protein